MFELESLRFEGYLTFAGRYPKRGSNGRSDVTLGLGRFGFGVFMTESRISNAECDLMIFTLGNLGKASDTSAILFFSWHQLFGKKSYRRKRGLIDTCY